MLADAQRNQTEPQPRTMLESVLNDCSKGVLQYSGLSAKGKEPCHVDNNRLPVPGDVYPIHFSQHKDAKDTGTPCH